MSFASLCTLLAVALSPSSPADVQVEERMLVEQAVAKYSRDIFAPRRLRYDSTPHEFATPHELSGPGLAPYRTPEHNALLASLAGGEVLLARDVVCSSDAAVDCVQVILRIGIPAIAGDSASASTYVFETVRDAGQETDTQLFLVKQEGAWKVVRAAISRHALMGRLDPPIKP